MGQFSKEENELPFVCPIEEHRTSNSFRIEREVFFSDSDKLSRERTWLPWPWEGMDAEKAALEGFYLLLELTLLSVQNRYCRTLHVAQVLMGFRLPVAKEGGVVCWVNKGHS